MNTHSGLRILPLILGLLAAGAAQAAAASDLDALEAEIRSFKEGPEAQFAPRTLTQAEGYLGAALLAREKGDHVEAERAIRRGREKLAEARETAARFQSTYPELIRARNAALNAARALADPSAAPPDWQADLDQAGKKMRQAVEAFESGDLNRARMLADKTRADYEAVLDRLLPGLADKTEDAIREAMHRGARRYAPQSLEMARAALGGLRAYLDGVRSTLPEQPDRALRLARFCAELTMKARKLSGERGSIESLLLENARLRADLGSRLGLSADYPIEVPADRPLLERADEVRAQLDALKARLAEQKARAEKACEAKIEKKLAEQKAELLAASAQQLERIREAFKAKLERETFEQKRLERLGKLFARNEARIYANPDGSILIRLSGLKFAPNRSRIESRYYDLLARLKDALKLYAERKVRIEGHTDNQGDVKFNQKLSLKRAEAVRDFLVSAGIDLGRLTALGYGEVRPIASNEFAKGRAMNRRIDIVIEAPPKEQGR